ncbi:hypothetical protein BGZ60DRAFT_428845 [Tricladium varicosporioides]|nr:hypothetical protein BGZ60DRAFT_428845 [Hymenoscyphus varicosporioides]
MASSSPYEGLEAAPAGLEVTPAALQYNAPTLTPHRSNQNKPLPSIGGPGFSQKEVSFGPQKRELILGIQRKKFWILLLATTVVLIIALLCGVIGSLSHKISKNTSSSTHASEVWNSSASPISTSTFTSSSPTPTKNPTLITSPSPSKSSTVLPTLLATLVNPLAPCATSGPIGPCNATDCTGMNSQNSPYGQCTSGSNTGCPFLCAEDRLANEKVEWYHVEEPKYLLMKCWICGSGIKSVTPKAQLFRVFGGFDEYGRSGILYPSDSLVKCWDRLK